MFKSITKSELTCLLKAKKNFKIINIEPQSNIRRFQVIPHSILFSEETLEQRATRLLNKNELIVVCYSDTVTQSRNTKRAADKLLSLGFKHVVEYFG